MSDKRTNYVLGTIIAGLAIVLAMGTAFPSMGVASTESTSLGLMGHVTVLAVEPDGSATYAQGDNVIMDIGLNAAGIHLFSTSADPFDEITLSSDTVGVRADAVPTLLTATNAVITETYSQTDTAATDGDCGTAVTTTCEQILSNQFTAQETDTLASVLLCNGGFDKCISWVDIDPDIELTTAVTQVTITYKISLSG